MSRRTLIIFVLFVYSMWKAKSSLVILPRWQIILRETICLIQKSGRMLSEIYLDVWNIAALFGIKSKLIRNIEGALYVFLDFATPFSSVPHSFKVPETIKKSSTLLHQDLSLQNICRKLVLWLGILYLFGLYHGN